MKESLKLSAAASAGLKAALVGLLILVLLIPLGMIKGLRDERQRSMESATEEVSAMAGGETVLATPYLAIPTVRTAGRVTEEGKTVLERVRETWCVFPARMDVRGTSRTSERRRGIYAVPVHSSDFALELSFEFSLAETGVPGLEPDWSAARLYFAYDDPRSLRSSPALVPADGTRRELRSGLAPLALAERAVSVPAALSVDEAAGTARFAGRLDLELSGARSVSFLPLADVNAISLEGNWPSPSFSGYRLPTDREYSEAGFRAAWYVDESGRTVPRTTEAAGFPAEAARRGAFGLDFFQPTDVYQRTHRALRYAVLFLVIPFGALFLLETLSRRRLHPVQYLLVGLANCLFYLLLLAAAEHLPFGAAYLTAAGAVSLLSAAYVGAALPIRRMGLYAFALLAVQYGYLYSALGSEDYALLIGSAGLFVLVAGAMAATRRVDWYGGERTGQNRA